MDVISAIFGFFFMVILHAIVSSGQKERAEKERVAKERAEKERVAKERACSWYFWGSETKVGSVLDGLETGMGVGCAIGFIYCLLNPPSGSNVKHPIDKNGLALN